eukprot:Hpha_TRINITY_DN7620_c0_g1::TRINITY_DN7620_c0_g1_i1::g.19284::m.19284
MPEKVSMKHDDGPARGGKGGREGGGGARRGGRQPPTERRVHEKEPTKATMRREDDPDEDHRRKPRGRYDYSYDSSAYGAYDPKTRREHEEWDEGARRITEKEHRSPNRGGDWGEGGGYGREERRGGRRDGRWE